MEISVTFQLGQRIDATFEGHVVHTDQPVEKGGENTAPSPYDLFLASLATCAGSYVLGFCRARNIPTDDIELVQHDVSDKYGARSIDIELHLPASFPEKYIEAIGRAIEGCKVKRTIAAQPPMTVTVTRSPEMSLDISA